MQDATARASPTAWALLDWMLHILPISRCAPHLREFHFVTILEQTLQEAFGVDALAQPTSTPFDKSIPAPARHSSESTLEEAQSSGRKRKRGAASAESPSKRVALEPPALVGLFDAVISVMISLTQKSEASNAGEGLAQAELMNVVLKTESAQAARVLKCWFIAVNRLFNDASAATSADRLNLGPILDLWDSRTLDSEGDSGASMEDFTIECLIPAIVLLQTLQQANTLASPNTENALVLQECITTLDKLLVRHMLAPARMVFMENAPSEAPTGNQRPNPLTANVAPLRATLLQAAQLEDSGEPIPSQLCSLFAAVPHLLSLAIRSSPARSLKSRVTERPWIHCAFVALAECAGCSFAAPAFKTTQASIHAVTDCLQVLSSHEFNIHSDTLKDLFWFHSGLEFPAGQAKPINWTLIEALVELDADIFLVDPRSKWHSVDDKPVDLASYLFHRISKTNFDTDMQVIGDLLNIYEETTLKSFVRKALMFDEADVAGKVLVPIMFAYTRNRDLLGFIDRWDVQLSTRGESSPPTNKIWESPELSHALSTRFEQSLTSTQISTIFEDHAKRLQVPKGSKKKGGSNRLFSSLILVRAMLLSLSSDNLIASLKPHLLTVWSTLRLWVQDKIPAAIPRPGLVWSILCQAFTLLWPIHLHDSRSLQKEELYPLVKEASKVVASSKSDLELSVDAYAFMVTASSSLQYLPDTTDLIVKCVRRVFKSLSQSEKDRQLAASILQLFCAENALLLGQFDGDDSKEIFTLILSIMSRIDHESTQHIMTLLSESVFTLGNQNLQTSWITALLDKLSETDKSLRRATFVSLLPVVPSSISREQRELLLDAIFRLLKSSADAQDASTMLSITVDLMEVTNATAKVSSDGAALFELAQHVHSENIETPLILQLLRKLAHLVLSHILPNKDQPQNKHFLEVYAAQISEATKKARKCFPARLSLLQGSFIASVKDADIIPVERYLEFLIGCLNEDKISKVQVLEAFGAIPAQILMNNKESFNTAQASLRKYASSLVPLQDHLNPIDAATFSSSPPQTWCTLYDVLGQYQLFESHEALLRFTSNLLSQELSFQQRTLTLDSFKNSLCSMSAAEKLNLVSACVPTKDDNLEDVTCHLLQILISTLNDKQEADAELKQQQMAILPQLCLLLERSSSDATFNVVLDSILTIIRDKQTLVTQYSIECVLAALSNIASRHSPRLSAAHAPAIYTRICETVRLVLILHRNRLGGRFHALLPLLQGLLLCLFIPNTGRGAALPPWVDPFSALPSSTRLTPGNAASLTRLLSTLCSPTQSAVTRHSHHHSSKSKSKNKSDSGNKDLNDPIKAARDYTAQFAYPLLSSFCRFQLYGRLDAAVRAELMPGIWEVISVASLERDALDAMFAGLGRSERDVWRGVWKDWEMGTGRGKKGDGEDY
ncbi:hypothetical protein DM02DRAFT_616188 [Periconia macrospinosa]|uniref:Nucleolar 27S pre-rRNA processing Urb2/Npa2 C-terminal domain-containing protein n=1 Tax=Periconia macrospinosa TaxID=97972 RepID=A0A2V1DL75_9PLEO|nr:hypothetical protein DM02DRAFT_616188 [Periconia macrospinosa]